MRIAQIAPLIEDVPPRLYGGTERIVSYLTESLVKQGHDVTLFASGQSITSARLQACTSQALRLNPAVKDPIPYYMIMLDKVRALADTFDVLHFHIDQFQFPVLHQYSSRMITTLHGRQDMPDLKPLYAAFPDMKLVSISNAQRKPISGANFAGTVHHGLPLDLHVPTFKPRGGYLAFLGRVSAEKRLDRAIEIARRIGMPLKIAAKIDRVDQQYYERVIQPMLGGEGIEFIGEIDERRKTKFLGEASALLFPIDWPEPFGLVMIESMACGTPVLAFRNGSVTEVIDEGVTGAVVDTVDEAAARLPDVLRMDRRKVRQTFEQRFAADIMARAYVRIYKQLLVPDPARARERAALAVPPRTMLQA